MNEEATRVADAAAAEGQPRKRLRADAQRSTDALITAAAEVFATSGVDAPVWEVTAKAGAGAGTLYRPRRRGTPPARRFAGQARNPPPHPECE
ncbi:hypothetical protein ACFVYV_36065 [Streptomyces mirabilis]|uniref:hypothetical protein n=1 Tax=Streptomyces mirabilis TaxID=68239 RepID=UPI0036D7D55E